MMRSLTKWVFVGVLLCALPVASADHNGPLLGDRKAVVVDMAWPLWKTQIEFDAGCKMRGGDPFGTSDGWSICHLSDGTTQVETADDEGMATSFRKFWYRPDKQLKARLQALAKKAGTKPRAYKRSAGGGGAAKCTGTKWQTWYRASRDHIYAIGSVMTLETCVYNEHRSMNFRVEIGDGRSEWDHADRY